MDRDTAEEIKRHFNAVAEGLRSEIRIVAEGVQSLRDEVTAEFKTVSQEIKSNLGCPRVFKVGLGPG